MDALNQVLVQLAGSLRESATVILFLRVCSHKGTLEELAAIRSEEEGSFAYSILTGMSHDNIRARLEAANHWHGSWYSKEYFNPKVLSKDRWHYNWEDKDGLLTIEYDCRSLALIIMSYVNETKKGNAIEIDPMDLHKKGLQLHRIANNAFGYWYHQLKGLLKKTEGYMKKSFTSSENLNVLIDLLYKHGGKRSGVFWKEARKLTGLSDRRIREYLVIAEEGRETLEKKLKDFLVKSNGIKNGET
jgi:hypothetical protein